MPNKSALVTFDQCHPEECPGGQCAALLVCPQKLIQQESPDEIPMFPPTTCRGCGDCVRACPLQAVRIVYR
ncbi:MAG: 4Fe-4S binding protein [Dehalococcoidales bacterium]